MLESVLNSYSSIELTNVLEAYFKIDCVMLSKSTDKLCGRIMNKFSNCLFKYNIKLKHHRLIVMSETCLGVIFPILFQREEWIEDLWHCFDIINFESITVRELHRKKFIDNLHMSNMPVTFNLKVDLHMVLSDDMSQFENAMWELISLDISLE